MSFLTKLRLPMARAARLGQRRGFAAVPKKGEGEGSFAKNYLSDPAAYPIIVVVGGALMLCAYKLGYDARDPNVHWGAKERHTQDYIDEDEKSASKRKARAAAIAKHKHHGSSD